MRYTSSPRLPSRCALSTATLTWRGRDADASWICPLIICIDFSGGAPARITGSHCTGHATARSSLVLKSPTSVRSGASTVAAGGWNVPRVRGMVRGEVERLEHEHRRGLRRGCGRSGCSAAIRGGTGGVRRKGEGENACSTCRTGLLGGGGAAAAVRVCDRRKRHWHLSPVTQPCVAGLVVTRTGCTTRLGSRRHSAG